MWGAGDTRHVAHVTQTCRTQPHAYIISSCYAPTDARYRPRDSGYWHWVDDDKGVHVIYGPDTPLPLPPSYQHVHTMSAAEAEIIAAASEAERRAATMSTVNLPTP